MGWHFLLNLQRMGLCCRVQTVVKPRGDRLSESVVTCLPICSRIIFYLNLYSRQGAVGCEEIHFVICSIQIDSSITNNDTRVPAVPPYSRDFPVQPRITQSETSKSTIQTLTTTQVAF